MSDLQNLIDRVEQASGPDREIDILVGAAVDLLGDDDHLAFRKSFEICGMKEMLRMAESHQSIWRTALPRYTASIDAALTLLPENYHYTIEPDGAWIRCMGKDDVDEFQCVLLRRGGECTALALCGAILKARQASTEGARK